MEKSYWICTVSGCEPRFVLHDQRVKNSPLHNHGDQQAELTVHRTKVQLKGRAVNRHPPNPTSLENLVLPPSYLLTPNVDQLLLRYQQMLKDAQVLSVDDITFAEVKAFDKQTSQRKSLKRFFNYHVIFLTKVITFGITKSSYTSRSVRSFLSLNVGYYLFRGRGFKINSSEGRFVDDVVSSPVEWFSRYRNN